MLYVFFICVCVFVYLVEARRARLAAHRLHAHPGLLTQLHLSPHYQRAVVPVPHVDVVVATVSQQLVVHDVIPVTHHK